MILGNNTVAYNCMYSIGIAQNSLAKSSTNMSTGLKIQSSKDDPTGMALSKQLERDVAAMESTSGNCTNGISIVQIADGALNEVNSMVQQINELTIYAANGTQTTEDREKIQEEIDSLTEGIDDIVNNTEYNGMKVFGGQCSKTCEAQNAELLRITSNMDAGTYPYEVTAAATQATYTPGTQTMTFPNTLVGTIYINDIAVTLEGGESKDDVYALVQDAANSTGVNVTTGNPVGTFTNEDYGSKYPIRFSGDPAILNALGLTNGTATTGTDAVITFPSGGPNDPLTAGATYTADGNRITINDVNGAEMVFDLQPGFVGPSQLVIYDSSMVIQTGIQQDQELELEFPYVDSEALGLDQISVMNQAMCQDAIEQTSKALDLLNTSRASLGAYQNRLDRQLTNIETMSLETQKALSRVRDADMAYEMTNYSTQQVILQASMSMLAQANEMPQMVLQLLQ